MKQVDINEKIRVIKLVSEGLCSSRQAAQALKISQRQVQRLVKILKEGDNNPLVLSPKPRSSWNKKSDKIVSLILALKRESSHRSNYAIADLVKEETGEKISPATVRKILLDNGCYQKEEVKRRIFKKFEAKKFGQILQMDTMEGCWLKGYWRTKLIMVIDDYSRAILGFKWAAHDTTWENMLVLRAVIEQYGLPKMVYTDNDSKFRIIRHGSIYFEYHQKEYQTEIHKALNELGILLINHPPYQAFCKGKIERLFRFIQERFLPESRAGNFEELNQEFTQWVSWYNLNHVNRMTGTTPKERFKPSCFKPLPRKKDLDYIFFLKVTRKIDKYNSFSLQGSRYFLKKQYPLVGERVEIAVNPTHRIKVYYEQKFIQEFKKTNN